MLLILISRWTPGLSTLLNYQREWFKSDVTAGISVAAVALPVAIAYASLVGVAPAAGLYSCILPMLAYAVFGSSKQLIIGPDAATCAVVAATVSPLAMGDPERYWQLVIVMTIMTGLWCLIASRFHLGMLADFLSRPILTGLLNGVAVTIIVGQLSKVFGFTYEQRFLIERVLSGVNYIAHSHIVTTAVSVLTLVCILACKRIKPRWPSSLLAMMVAAFTVWLFNLSQYNVATIGYVQAGLPVVQWPVFPPGLLRDIVMPALNLAVVSFVSMMLTARSFAAKNGYDIDPDQEFRALGLANLAAAFSQGFAVSGADSRTAVNDANGGKSQLVSIVAALMIAVVMFFFTTPLQYVPIAALGVVLIYSSFHLMDLRGLFFLRKRNKSAFWLALFTFISVLVMGVIPGIMMAVLLALAQFMKTVFRPTEQLLGLDEEGLVRSLGNGNGIKSLDQVMIYRFNSPLTYFNVPYFKKRVLELVDTSDNQPRWVVLDAVSSFTYADVSVLAVLGELQKALKRRNIRLVIAGRLTEMTRWLKDSGLQNGDYGVVLLPDIYLAVRLVQSAQCVECSLEGGGTA
ncbi:MAG: SulP family inorganic anion transporter [Plesiomonas sp.]|uniref:SulP family inorganic anion transporter n=1 Tax=Plesiomonas sp. TaxID=2486279 RepID=UPI003F2A5A2A